jgi:hypothetical protein
MYLSPIRLKIFKKNILYIAYIDVFQKEIFFFNPAGEDGTNLVGIKANKAKPIKKS